MHEGPPARGVPHRQGRDDGRIERTPLFQLLLPENADDVREMQER